LLGGADLFVNDIISGGLLGHLGPLCLALDGSISLKFLLAPRLQSESFDAFAGVLGSKVMI